VTARDTGRDQDPHDARAAAERRRRRAEIFGEVLPDRTGDERDPGSDDASVDDAWLRANVPPHHG